MEGEDSVFLAVWGFKMQRIAAVGGMLLVEPPVALPKLDMISWG